MRVDTKPRKRNAPRLAEKAAPGFLQWLRGRNCAVCGYAGRVESAHVDFLGNKGIGTKTEDKYSIPLCPKCHREQHNSGWKTFQKTHAFDAAAASSEYWRAWPGRFKWEAKLAQGSY